MASSQNPNFYSSSLYPEINKSNPHKSNPSSSMDMNDLVENLFPESPHGYSPSAPLESVEEILIRIPCTIVHLIDKQFSVELASGDLMIFRLRQGDSIVAVLARVADDIQWPLAKDGASVKLDESHYFFTLKVPSGSDSDDEDNHIGDPSNSTDLLNYGVTIVSSVSDDVLKELDQILGQYTNFSAQEVKEKSEALDSSVSKQEEKKERVEERSSAYWTTLAPNVEEYSGYVAKSIASGTGHLIKGILWCGDVTVDRLKWGDEFLKKRLQKCLDEKDVSPETLKRIQRVKAMTQMSQKVANGVLSGVIKVSGYFTQSVANSKVGKKFIGLIPGEIVLASVDGFGKVCDALEVAGKNVMSTTSVVTTGLVQHKHGEKVAKATNEGLEAAGHALGAALSVLKIRHALNPKHALKPTAVAKFAAKATVSNQEVSPR